MLNFYPMSSIAEESPGEGQDLETCPPRRQVRECEEWHLRRVSFPCVPPTLCSADHRAWLHARAEKLNFTRGIAACASKNHLIVGKGESCVYRPCLLNAIRWSVKTISVLGLKSLYHLAGKAHASLFRLVVWL